MKHQILIGTLLAGGFLMSQSSFAQVQLVKNSKPTSRIVVAGSDSTDMKAASLLQDFIQKVSGAQIPIVKNGAAKKNDIAIGTAANPTLASNSSITNQLKEDGFLISTNDGVLRILSGGDKGSIYAVVTLLENELGIQYFGENEYNAPKQQTIEIPKLEIIDNPAFRYRQSQNYAMGTDPIYKLWYRLEEPNEVFAGGYWVHTFDRLLPSEVYGESHPEYYSYFNGKRHPGKASQWCLSNDEVFEIVSQRLDSIFKANPGKNLISVSQNDGNYTNCQCPQCKAIDEKEGALSGSVIHFLNKLATRFPDKEFSTLAYLYTMNPPQHVKPLPNVNIMLCDIDCMREVGLTENKTGKEFVKALEGWSAISDNLFIWDYGINFDNYVAPFPNLHILKDNIKLFKKNNATMHFSQIASNRGGDFAELRTYLVSKLMWNPELDTDSLTQNFLQGYYGDAAPAIYKYIKLMEGALLGSGVNLWIYDSPVTHKNGMLKPELMRRYNQLFDEAEASVADDNVLLTRVRRARLPIQYSELEIARTEQKKDLKDIVKKLDLFEERVTEYNIPTLNERNNSPVEYCKLYRQRYLPQAATNKAANAKITFLNQPGQRYVPVAEQALTDGLFGGSTFVESWIGWEGQDASFIIDLGSEKEINSIEADFLHQLGAWILLPTQVKYSVSTDNNTFTQLATKDIPEDRSPQVKFVGIKHEAASPVSARYIKVEITGTKTCPHWHYGVGHPCWFFLDEVTVL
ncbi:MAG TPA: DUF4838 domain-containing protein [Porphyromonadaceae bacterium]|nr:DUF4838 domain-containing protein [Porphyromonadaceae bacterium]